MKVEIDASDAEDERRFEEGLPPLTDSVLSTAWGVGLEDKLSQLTEKLSPLRESLRNVDN